MASFFSYFFGGGLYSGLFSGTVKIAMIPSIELCIFSLSSPTLVNSEWIQETIFHT